MEDNKQPPVKEAEPRAAAEPEVEAEAADTGGGGGGGGGWGGWGFSPLSILSDLQKAAEEISRNAAEVAKTAAKSITDAPDVDENSESSKEEEGPEKSDSDEENDEKDKLRKSALDRLGNASQDTVLGQGLKVIDSSVENFASGAWQALGSAWKGGSDFVQKLENSAANIAGGIPAAGSVAPSLLETGKAFTAKGIQVLEYVGKETMDLLITEVGLDVDKNSKGRNKESEDDHSFEEVTFDRCFYIYGGPEQLEELEALSSHYTLLFNRRKAKLSSEQKSLYGGKLEEVQKIFDMSTEIDLTGSESDKGKKTENYFAGNDEEMKSLHDSSVKQAADMAAGFTNAITGIAAGEVIQKTAGRLENLHSEGVHRLSEMCCFAVTQFLMVGKSIISSVNKAKDENDGDGDDEEISKINWPEDSVEKAKLIRARAKLMADNVEAISRSFITGISDVAEAYLAAIKRAAADSNEASSPASIQEKAKAFSEHLTSDQNTAVGKIQDGLQYLSYLVITSSMPSA